MMTFKEFMGSQEMQPQAQPQAAPSQQSTKWKATKDEIVAYWKNLRPDTPVQMRAIDYAHTGSTYGEDGMRLTGSPQFISSILARMKELLAYETPTTKLAVTYRQTESPSKMAMGQSKTSYVFYVAARQRGNGEKKN
jgi:hypothetical protein